VRHEVTLRRAGTRHAWRRRRNIQLLLVYFETYESVLEARSREHTLKRWRRAWKLKLIEDLNPDWRDLTDELNTLAT